MTPERVDTIRRMLIGNEGHTVLLAHLARELMCTGQYDEAERLIPAMGDYYAAPLLRSQIALYQGRVDNAVAIARQAVVDRPDCPITLPCLAFTLQFTERQIEAAHYNDAGACTSVAAPLLRDIPRWEGDPVGHLLITVVEGIGDLVSLSRWLPLALQRARRVTIATLPMFADYLAVMLAGHDNLSFWTDLKRPPPDVSAWRTYTGIPAAIGMTDEEWLATPWLVPELPEVPEFPCGAVNIGICWDGGAGSSDTPLKSVPIERFLALHRPGIQLYSLQKEGGAELIRKGYDRVIDLAPQMRSLRHTMALISKLDLVVSIDGVIAHMAGAVRKECWVPLSIFGGWRYQNKLVREAWYPRHRLFIQQHPGDWGKPFRDIDEALRVREAA